MSNNHAHVPVAPVRFATRARLAVVLAGCLLCTGSTARSAPPTTAPVSVRVYQAHWADGHFLAPYLVRYAQQTAAGSGSSLVVIDGRKTLDTISLKGRGLGPVGKDGFVLTSTDQQGQRVLEIYDPHGKRTAEFAFDHKELLPLLASDSPEGDRALSLDGIASPGPATIVVTRFHSQFIVDLKRDAP